jgi:gliding motility-associated-like protein
MKFYKNFIYILFFVFTNQVFTQSITVDDTRSAADLVNLLIGNSCATTSNIQTSSNQSVAYFNQNGSIFPIPEGVLIRSGIASHTQGVYSGVNLDSQVNTNSDADLQQISNNSGQVAQITDVAFLEFDFVPPSTNFNFNFLFSSNEYGEWQCGFSDVFAFILTDLVTGEKINLAVVPASGNPISVKEIRDNQYNASCNSVNPQLFGKYNVTDASNSAINMRGHTVVMNASATIKPNNPYRIKLVIGDYNDSKYDSAVFIEAGSFGNFLDLGDDVAICNGETTTLNSGFTNTTDYTYEWKKDNATIIGETTPTLSVTETGTYEVLVTFNATTCVITDQVIVSDLAIINPPDLAECDNGAATVFNLTENNITTLGLDPTKYSLSYFSSIDNLNNNIPIDPSITANYSSPGNVTIYGRVSNISSSESCIQTINFQLTTNNITATKPADIATCEESIFDVPTAVNSQILNGLNASQHTITFFNSLVDAQNNVNPVSDQYTIVSGASNFTLWARLVENSTATCFDITDFTVIVNPNPVVQDVSNVFACSSYTLQSLINGNYYTGTNGTGTLLNAGDVITDTQSLFIYAEENGCTAQTSFNITIVEEFTMNTEYCGEFLIPVLEYGDFYTQPDGPNGTGAIITTGTAFTNNTTIYYYSDFENIECTDLQFDIIVHPLPIVDTLADITTCLSYTLPVLTNGDYFTEANGLGTPLNAGDAITTTHTVFIYSVDSNTCTNETSFNITIIDTTIFQDETVCGSYTIPTLTVGNFFTQTNGTGTQLNAGEILTTSQTIYFYAPTNNGCADNIQINITINPLPEVDSLPDFLTCVNAPMSLPTLRNGNYFTSSGGLGFALNAGDIITTTQTIYIYSFDGTCPNETSFLVEVRPLPSLNSFTDVFSCSDYTLPAILNGKYYTQSGALGTQLNAGDLISSTQTLYVYNEYDDLKSCTNEAFFTVHIIGVEVDKPTNVTACESYTLPTLTTGNYFTQSNGLGVQLNAGDAITTTQDIYVYANNGNRFFCSDEHLFTVTITNTPVILTINNVESCGTFTLPDLTLTGSTINYYKQPNKVDQINPADYIITTEGTQTIYVFAEATENASCTAEIQFDVTIHPLLDFTVQGGIICVDSETNQTTNPFLLESGLDPAIFTVNWYLDNQLVGTGENYAAVKAGTYTVETVKLTPDVGSDCNYNPTQVIVKESIPKAEVYFLTGSFTSPANIRVDITEKGFGNYDYRLNDGSYQTSNLFHGLDFGEHTVYVRDLSGICNSEIAIQINVINYPYFFTPNGDGTNDYWNIPDLSNYPEAKISIYNRFGQVVAKIEPTTIGWNGTLLDGTAAPSTDYWFKIEFVFQGKPTVFTSNFSLIRK